MSTFSFANKENIVRVPKTPPGKKAKGLRNKHVNLFNNENALGAGKKLNFKTSPLKSQNININNLEGKKLFNGDVKKLNDPKTGRIPLGGKDKNKVVGFQPVNTNFLNPNQTNNKIFVQKDNSNSVIKGPTIAHRRRIRTREPLNLNKLNQKLKLAALDGEDQAEADIAYISPTKKLRLSIDFNDIEKVPKKIPELPYVPNDYTPLDDYDLQVFSQPNCLARTKENGYEYDEILQNEQSLQFKEIDDIDFTFGELEPMNLVHDSASPLSIKTGGDIEKRFMHPTISSVNRSRSHTGSSSKGFESSLHLAKVTSSVDNERDSEDELSERKQHIFEDEGLSVNELEGLLDY